MLAGAVPGVHDMRALDGTGIAAPEQAVAPSFRLDYTPARLVRHRTNAGPGGSPVVSGSDQNARDAWIERVLGIQVPGPAAAASAANTSATASSAANPAQAAWTAARAQALAGLAALEAAVKGSPHPGRDKAVIILRALRANLIEMPGTLQQVAELRRYLATDDIVDAAETPNVFGVQLRLRVPLLGALDALHAHLVGGDAPLQRSAA